ncbi:MAG: glutaredoxin family protein [Acidobacteria bacterium]|nr:MAG: glutaredoxin family protein [Acidobacteriota bacterium]
MSNFSIRFLTRPGCHLCNDARPLVEWAAMKVGVVIEEIDVDGDDTLLSLYGVRIPVVLGPGDEVLAEGVIGDRKALEKALLGLEWG